jgi:hypothetical protein
MAINGAYNKTDIPTLEDIRTFLEVQIEGIQQYNVVDFSVREATLSESLLTPGLQTSILVDSFMHVSQLENNEASKAKNFDDFKSKIMKIRVTRPLLQRYGMQDRLDVSQRIYRLDRRNLINNNNEQFRIHACDDTLLNDARSLVSKSWKCTTPTQVVEDVLRSCAGATRIETESSGPPRDYIAENIHPFQVVTQQANAALADGGNDPSFVHYMTYENLGTHHFKSIYNLSRQPVVNSKPFIFTETGINTGYGYPYSIMSHSFPCDFDLLSDLLNGVDTDGSFRASLTTVNTIAATNSLYGDQTLGCGIGAGIYNISRTNFNTEQSQDQCRFEVEKYLLRRQARMSLLEQDKIALKLTVPWNPMLNAGKMIDVKFPRKGTKRPEFLYGSGKYLIVNLVHTVKNGGFSTTTIECVAQTAGQGIV